MTARWRIPIYAALLAALAGFAALRRPDRPETVSQRRESGPPPREICREPAKPARPAEALPEFAEATKQPARVVAPDAPREFVDAAALSDGQAARVSAWTAEWRGDLERLAGEARARGLGPSEVSDRASAIQAAFESRLRSLLSPAQMNVYESFHREGRMGTYVIEMPRASSP